jgi:hypothetical protein
MAKEKRTFVPAHVVVLDKLQAAVQTRLQSHRNKCGDGVSDIEYNRLVGRVKECKTLLTDIEDLRVQLRNDDEVGD